MAAAFAALAAVPREQRVARMCRAVPASAGMYEPEHMTRLFQTFRQSVFAITRYDPDPYAGDITFLRHSGAYPFPGSATPSPSTGTSCASATFASSTCPVTTSAASTVEHAPGVVKLLGELTDGAVTR